ncbi:MAG: hypothetical protein HZB29_00320 [Nitrospinae bacterium]|nr:hypothetical protein [Nitrospinota bacterium]
MMMTFKAQKYASIIPVIDVRRGVAVHAMGGDRAAYRPVASPMFSSADPVHIVKRLSHHFGFRIFYVADLDSIEGGKPNLEVMERLLSGAVCDFMLDGGYRRAEDLPGRHPRLSPIVATETFKDWANLGTASNPVVSLDTRGGKLIGASEGEEMEKLLRLARMAGINRFINLRLDAVGSGNLDSDSLIKPRYGEEWIAGGGVSSREDLALLWSIGYKSALAATALYSGKLA